MNATMLSGNDVAELRAYIEKCQIDPRATERRPVLTGVWTGVAKYAKRA